MGERIAENANSNASKNALTRKAQAIHEAIESGQNLEAVIKREDAIEQAEHDRKMRLLEYAS